MKLLSSVSLILTFFCNSYAENINGLWITTKIKIVYSNEVACDHGRGIWKFNQDGTFIFKRSGKPVLKGTYTTNPTIEIYSADNNVQVEVTRLSQTRLKIILTKSTHSEVLTCIYLGRSKLKGFDVLKKINNKIWYLDKENSTFSQWPSISFTNSNIFLTHDYHGTLVPYADWLQEFDNHNFLMLGFEHNGFVVELTTVTNDFFEGFIYSMPMNIKGNFIGTKECELEPKRYKVSYKLKK